MGPPSVPVRERWADCDYASEYDRLARYVAESPDGVPVPVAAAVGEVVDDPSETDRRRARRFYREFDDLFRVFEPTSMVAVPVAESDDPDKKYDYENRETDPDLVWVEPQDGASPSIASIGNSDTADSDGAEPPSHDDLPRERAASFLSSMPWLTSDRQRALLLRYFADHNRLHGRGDGGTDEDAGRVVETAAGTVTVGDRFTSSAQAAETVESLDENLAGLRAVAVDDGVETLTHVSLTLPREAVDSPVDSVETLGAAIEALHARWRRPKQDGSRNRPGEVPPHVIVVEAQGDLTAHAHIVYAGRPQPEDDLKAEWGEIVDAPPWKPPQVSVESVSVDDAAAVERLFGYFGETARDLERLAAMSADRLEGHADDLVARTAPDEVRRLARLALLFATESRIVRATPGLRDAADADPDGDESDGTRTSESLARPLSTGEYNWKSARSGARVPPQSGDSGPASFTVPSPRRPKGVATRDRPPPVRQGPP
ncbi:hypothetical protein [Halapricum hydrolyticum]|uniref:Uncharacterized protein n=1 Tax=Halapricum hydrolyticum TaxID=2979991 RepID=A0AAE3LGL9_9EURY|nr:hypothetical protein [Halapricum hydrolyticum]MCU4716621.1 hypothetical protein [Halapricum hydrolyticum]MCU4725774.1 hypothetical protein [Halapricum hydrolyticum]